MAVVLVLVAITVIAVLQGSIVSRPRLAPAPVPPDDSAYERSRVDVYRRLRILPDMRERRGPG